MKHADPMGERLVDAPEIHKRNGNDRKQWGRCVAPSYFYGNLNDRLHFIEVKIRNSYSERQCNVKKFVVSN